ncbi:MAG: hypothetical protein UDB11_02685 [Peptococcaceae bacterium]|nr:hypothetical protein [Peptococcaceae bacterium]
MEIIISIIAIIIQIAMLFIIFSLPSRFREQREYMEAQHKELERKLDMLLAAQKKE